MKTAPWRKRLLAAALAGTLVLSGTGTVIPAFAGTNTVLPDYTGTLMRQEQPAEADPEELLAVLAQMHAIEPEEKTIDLEETDAAELAEELDITKKQAVQVLTDDTYAEELLGDYGYEETAQDIYETQYTNKRILVAGAVTDEEASLSVTSCGVTILQYETPEQAALAAGSYEADGYTVLADEEFDVVLDTDTASDSDPAADTPDAAGTDNTISAVVDADADDGADPAVYSNAIEDTNNASDDDDDDSDGDEVSYSYYLHYEGDYMQLYCNADGDEDVIVAMIDSGCNTEYLESGRCLTGYNVLEDSTDVTDNVGHGTMTSSLIVRYTGSNVSVLPIKALDTDDGSSSASTTASNLISAFAYALSQGADVVNLSIAVTATYTAALYSFKKTVGPYIDALIESGASVVCSAGNSSQSVDYQFPACYEPCWTISAIGYTYTAASYSNYGAVDFCAPGNRIIVTNGSNGVSVSSSGTSFSAPLVSVVAAQMAAAGIDTDSERYAAAQAICLDLGDEGYDEYYGYGLPVMEHNYSLSEVFTEATCEEDGEGSYTCPCGETATLAIEATGHTWDEGAVTTEAGCGTDGIYTYTCTACEKTYTEVIPATGNHTWDEGAVTTEAGCGTAGVYTYTCTECGTTYTEDIPATGSHSWDEGAVTTEAGCGTDGVYTYTCMVCGTTYTEDIPATGNHSWDEGAVTKEAGCGTAGVYTYTCTECGSTYTESIPATGNHTWDEGTVLTEATCTTAGEIKYSCINCKSSYTRDISATGHSWDEGTLTQEASCTDTGVMTYTCTVCEETYTEDIAATGHSYTLTGWTWADDCGSAAAVFTCGVCDTVYYADASVTSETTAATCIEDGVTVYTATVTYGGTTYTDTQTITIAATGHSYEAVVTEPTCTEGGYTTYTCSVCGDTYVADETEATGHSYGSDGYCTVCGDYSAEADETGTALPAEDDTSAGITGGTSYAVPSSKIAAEKVSLTGATIAQVTQTLAKLTNDGDLADSTYYLLQAKAKKTTKKSVKLSWKKVSGAASYVIYANACGKGKKLKKYKVTSKTSLNITKIAGKKLTSGKYYKFLVIALDADGKVIQTSKVIHAATKGGKVTNEKSITLYKSGKKVSSLTLKKGKSVKLTAKTVKQEKKKTLKRHRKVKYESSSTKIATVNSSGKIKAKSKGTCYIYAYAQNGVCRRIKVTVK